MYFVRCCARNCLYVASLLCLRNDVILVTRLLAVRHGTDSLNRLLLLEHYLLTTYSKLREFVLYMHYR
jgi:hypothetical protein